MSSPSTPSTAPTTDGHDDFVTPEKKKKVTTVYKLGPLKITKTKEVRTDKKPSGPAKLMQKIFTCGDCNSTAD
eukprot:scaffold9223_cov72-Skeletonema_dohrnii-CCMP3373.AAC.3